MSRMSVRESLAAFCREAGVGIADWTPGLTTRLRGWMLDHVEEDRALAAAVVALARSGLLRDLEGEMEPDELAIGRLARRLHDAEGIGEDLGVEAVHVWVGTSEGGGDKVEDDRRDGAVKSDRVAERLTRRPSLHSDRNRKEWKAVRKKLGADLQRLLEMRDELAGTAALNWEEGVPAGKWKGVKLSEGDDSVVGLRLDWLEVNGRIPAELGNLANLESLRLDHNSLSGRIPRELGNLKNLKWLNVKFNKLSGPIPREFGNLANLIGLHLGNNSLSGPIPRELGNLANLESLHLEFNKLSGPIPRELGNLADLRYLELDHNSLSGPIPRELENLANLGELSLDHNSLSGPIPRELENLANLESLHLGSNEFSGPIPRELGNLANLERLDLGSNEFSGPIPRELGNLAKLRWLNLENNSLSGPIPPMPAGCNIYR